MKTLIAICLAAVVCLSSGVASAGPARLKDDIQQDPNWIVAVCTQEYERIQHINRLTYEVDTGKCEVARNECIDSCALWYWGWGCILDCNARARTCEQGASALWRARYCGAWLAYERCVGRDGKNFDFAACVASLR